MLFEEAEKPVGEPYLADARRGSVILCYGGTAVEREIDKRGLSFAEAVSLRVDTDMLRLAVVPCHNPMLVYPPFDLLGAIVHRQNYMRVLLKCHIRMDTRQKKEGTHHKTENG